MNATHLIIFNREPAATADGWIHIVPKGELPNREAGLVQVLDDTALDSILAGITADQQRLGNRWPGIYAGKEHFIYNDEQDSAALAWFKKFEKRADGIWAHEEGLTDTGREAISNRRYKYTSFVASRSDTQKLEGNKVRILKIDTVGFTNQPNGRELLNPITNREPFPSHPADNKNLNRKNQMKTVCTLLGLSAEADEASVHAAVTTLKNRAEKAETEVTPLKNRVTEIETLNGTLLNEQVDALMDANQIKDDKIRNKLKPVLLPMKNREERVAFIKDCVVTGKDVKKDTTTRLLNREDGQQPGEGKGVETGDEVKAKSDKIMNRARDLQKNGLTFAAAHEQATRDFHAGAIQ